MKKILKYFQKRKEEKCTQAEELSKRQRIFRKAIGYVFYVGILIGLFYGTPKILSYLLNTKYPFASITSGSMWPVLKKGDLALICSAEPSEIKTNDVVVFPNENGALAIHRVVKINGDKIITKGDANTKEDKPINRSDILGRLCTVGSLEAKIPKLGLIAPLFH
ncbi:MAG: signal peptidase I [Candidatus Doudnabacteria bacterium]